jgi:putative ABC transport system substrate-binding protein
MPPPSIGVHQKRILELTEKNRLPAMHSGKGWVEAGGLMSYGPDAFDNDRRAAILVDKILKGAKPADLPVEQPTKFELVINLKTAKKIGVTILTCWRGRRKSFGDSRKTKRRTPGLN